MNPLNVLRGASLMKPVKEIERRGEQLLLDWSGHNLMTLDPVGAPAGVTIEGKPGRLAAFRPDLDLMAIGADGEVIVTASANIMMKTAIEIRHATGRPVALLEDDRLIGVVGDEEIYKGMLRQTGIADTER